MSQMDWGLLVAAASAVIAGIALWLSVKNANWQRDYLQRQEQREVEAAERERQADVPVVEVVVRLVSRGQALSMTATNIGRVPVSVTEVALLTNVERAYFLRLGQAELLPMSLAPGEPLTAHDSVVRVKTDMHEHGDWVVGAFVRAAGGLRWDAADLGAALGLGKPNPPDELPNT